MSGMIVRRFPTPEEAQARAAQYLRECADESIAARGRFMCILTGGSSVNNVYETLASGDPGKNFPWEKTHIFFSDERMVTPSDTLSNHALVRERLLNRVPLPQSHIHIIRGDTIPPENAAQTYENEMRTAFPDVAPGKFPCFDFCLLGMGPDGHVASLFPGQSSLDETSAWAVYVPVAGHTPLVARTSLTLPVLNASRTVLFLAFGEAKKTLIERITTNPHEAAQDYPAARISPAGTLYWFVNT
ncbi:6-phosphogluconolactonase [Desulfovibrio inopinatus]|uniref:6-phosphogluconolactonase n=1 Tax=Desulfovibrio inopinatus TaxID=102109 RepID=UPI0003FA6FB1|nr:6-phosphogluconolactonase [Desulfovibrio inopinatus]